MNLPNPKLKVIIEKDQVETVKNHTGPDGFQKISNRISAKLGSVWAFFIALLVILVWAITGPVFDFSDTWQLVINTGTTIVTFLMVFVIQNTQNRDGKAIQIKLDELIKSSKGARSEFVSIEDLSDHELDELNNQFKLMHQKIRDRAARQALRQEQQSQSIESSDS
jgi:low affinity Fe/Cu permease